MTEKIAKDIKIVLVDDEEVNLILLEALLDNEGYSNYNSFINPVDAQVYLENNKCDIILVDYNMPTLDGITLLKNVKEKQPSMMSIMITASQDSDIMIDALDAGVNDFLVKPISGVAFSLRFKNMSRLSTSIKLSNEFNIQLKERIEIAVEEIQNRELEALDVLSKAAEYKDPETASHIARVSHYAQMIAQKIGFDEAEQKVIFYAAPLHDLGKIGIPDQILLKPGKLTDEEFNTMKAHTSIGSKILKNKDNIYLNAGETIAKSHHEKYDGSGYPQGLKGEDIPIYGRIVAIADVFDALTSVRPYKKAWSFEEALDFIIEQKSKHFDPKLVSVFVDSIDEVKVIYNNVSQ